jgi:hypothetical protein
MGPEELIVSAIMSGAALVVMGVARVIKRIRYGSRVTIADAKPGAFVRIVGIVIEGGELRAPISGRACVCYDAAITGKPQAVDRYGLRAVGSGTVKSPVLTRRLQVAPFVIDDGTGRALVDARGAYVRLNLDYRSRGPGAIPTSCDPEMIPVGLRPIDVVFVEGILRIGENVVVDAMVADGTDAEDASLYRAASPPRIRLVGGATRSAHISNIPSSVDAAFD